jgi:hypothetical protein
LEKPHTRFSLSNSTAQRQLEPEIRGFTKPC